jgi:Fe-S oxidoreductase
MEEKVIHNINKWGVHRDPEGRKEILFKEIGCPSDKKAEYVFLSGCLPPFNAPEIFQSLKNLLEHFEVEYTFLSKEYCCGFLPLIQPAIIAKDQEKIEELRDITKRFILNNIEQAKALGARGVVTVCAPCEPNYSSIKEEAGIEIFHYHQFLAPLFREGALNLEANYYAGCMRFRRRISNLPFDPSPIEAILNNISGLNLNYIDSNLCCFIPSHMERILESIKDTYLITPCTGCRDKLKQHLKHKGDFKVKFLTETMWESLNHGA